MLYTLTALFYYATFLQLFLHKYISYNSSLVISAVSETIKESLQYSESQILSLFPNAS
jgi:hypothetical protein